MLLVIYDWFIINFSIFLIYYLIYYEHYYYLGYFLIYYFLSLGNYFPLFCSFLPNILAFYLHVSKIMHMCTCSIVYIYSACVRRILGIIVLRAYSFQCVISGEWWLLHTQNSGPRDHPLPSRFNSTKVRDSHAVIANAPSLFTSQYKVDNKQGEWGCEQCCYIMRVATLNDF